MTLFLIAGFFYALLFWFLACKQPVIALSAVVALAPIQANVGAGGLRFSPTEIHLFLLVPLLIAAALKKTRSANLGPLFLPIFAYFLICLFSLMLNWRGASALTSMMQMGLYMVITPLLFAVLLPVEKMRVPLIALTFTASLWSIIGMATSFTFLASKNGYGSSLAVGFLVAFDLWLGEHRPRWRTWFAIATITILSGLILSVSRGAWLGTIAGTLVIILLRRASGKLIGLILILIPIIFLCWNLLPQEMRDYAFGFSADRYNIKLRYESLSLAQQNFAQDRVLGAGVGLRKQYDATNLAWSTLAETGVLGLLTFAWIFIAFYRMVWRAKSMLAPNDPMLGLLCLGAALMTCKLMHGMVDHYWSRGAITIAWAGAGMALHVFQELRRRRGVTRRSADRLTLIQGRTRSRSLRPSSTHLRASRHSAERGALARHKGE